jgi:hypothetical protein
MRKTASQAIKNNPTDLMHQQAKTVIKNIRERTLNKDDHTMLDFLVVIIDQFHKLHDDWPTEKEHYHQAKYSNEGELLRECKLCGKDLMDGVHIRG